MKLKVKKFINKMILLSFILSFGAVAQAAATNVYEASEIASEMALIRDNLMSRAVYIERVEIYRENPFLNIYHY